MREVNEGEVEAPQKITELAVQYLLNDYYSTLSSLKEACYLRVVLPRRQAAEAFISSWIRLDTRIRSNLSNEYDDYLRKMESFLLGLSEEDFEDTEVYRDILAYGRGYSRILRSCGLDDLVAEDRGRM